MPCPELHNFNWELSLRQSIFGPKKVWKKKQWLQTRLLVSVLSVCFLVWIFCLGFLIPLGGKGKSKTWSILQWCEVRSLVQGDPGSSSPEPERSWCCGILFFLRKTPISQNIFCPAICTSAKMNVPSWNFWKPKQFMAHLLLCKQWSGPRYFWKFPSVCNSLCQYEFFFSSHWLSPSPNTSWIHNTGMSHGSEKVIKREMRDPGQQGWVSAWLDRLFCANQKEHSVH